MATIDSQQQQSLVSESNKNRPNIDHVLQYTVDDYLKHFTTSLSSATAALVTSFLASPPSSFKPPMTVSERFGIFAKDETMASGLNDDFLVRPSGELTSELGAKLHYPSFHTPNKVKGAVADYGASCVRLLITKGLNADTCFMYEEYYRRQEAPKNRSSPMRLWSKELREIHQEFNEWFEKYGQQKVVLLFGRHVQNGFREGRKYTEHFVEFNPCLKVEFLIVYDENNAIKVIALYIPHPENYLRPHTEADAQHADIVINLAAALTKKYSEVDATFFQRRALHKSGNATPEEDNGIFNYQGNAMSTIHEALKFEGKHSSQFTMETMPDAIMHWLVCKYETQNLDDIEKFVLAASEEFPGGKDHSLVRSCQILMLRGGAETREKKRVADAELEYEGSDKKARGIPKSVRVYCSNCKLPASEVDDTTPKWTDDGVYIDRKRRSCPTKGCCDTKSYTPKGKPGRARKSDGKITRKGERIFIPVDSSIAHISYNLVNKKKPE